jgi:hypothetical protein
VVAPEIPVIRIGIVPSDVDEKVLTVNVAGPPDCADGLTEALTPAIAPMLKLTALLPKLPNGFTEML